MFQFIDKAFHLPLKCFTSFANKINYSNKYKKILLGNNDFSHDTLSKYIKIFRINNYNFIIYGILHGNIYEKSCSGKDCSELLKSIKTDYVLLELCDYRLNRIFDIISKKKNNYSNNYSKFTYLPRIHNGFLQCEFLPIIEECLKNKLKIFAYDRNINIIKNRLDLKLLYDTKAYRKFFTYCIESISLRHYPYDTFVKLYNDYDLNKIEKKETKNVQSELNLDYETKTNSNNEKKKNNNVNEDSHTNTYESSECLKKLKVLNLLNERLKSLSKPTYDVLVNEKCKYVSSNIWGFLLNNETNFFENNSTKNIVVVCSANILKELVEELNLTYMNLSKKYNNQNYENLIYENQYSSYNDYVKPHWPLIIIKYYFIPYFILYIILNMLYTFCSWIYKSNFQKNSSISSKIIDIEV
ncbi:conserved Plasmodium protein, unknown function [Plasmodium relictum]|uniref:Uncharacterized protein n=1 Tax=Plasmodium relictum TaxID=85471 RepID=A0A1J1HGF8_PLARL|nr:conserved Plasmodium protein, unknown function [Plasmodium relictum]CRH02933.1 conserved Plasmodium protein, unknown function [Plasmodium relictum]